MQSQTRVTDEPVKVTHPRTQRQQASTLQVLSGSSAHTPTDTSAAHFFKEHRWGYGSSRRGERVSYEVRHPVREVYFRQSLSLNWELGACVRAPVATSIRCLAGLCGLRTWLSSVCVSHVEFRLLTS